MKNLIASLILLFAVTSAVSAQDSKWPDLDKSPMDMLQYPNGVAWRNYLSGEDRNLRPKLQIVYARPQKKGRTIFGDLVPYGKEWRMGANEATEMIFYQATNFGGVTVPRGAYTVFATPQKDHWVFSLSSQRNIWGANKRDLDKTVATLKVPTETAKESREELSIAFQKVDDNNANMVVQWDLTQVTVPINFNPVLFDDLDVSPLDQAMYPAAADGLNYLTPDKLEANQPKIKVRYSRPQMKGRKIFGELLKYGEVWRVGANQSTVVRFYQDVSIKGTAIKAGSYNLYAVVNETSWDLIFNTDMPAWGAANRDEEKDVAKVNVAISQGNETLEALGIIFEKQSDNEVHMIVGWDKTRAKIPVKFVK